MRIDPHLGVRRRLGTALQKRVAGSDAAEAHDRIWGSEGERWFGPEDPIWRVHSDASMFVGGIASLLLQSLHPLAMAGVAGHSGYRGDPWGRLQRTSHYLAITTFGTIEHAEGAIGVVRSIHRRVVGVAPDGRGYSAADPRLLLWVHVAEIRCFLRAYQEFGGEPLTDHEADVYVEQAGRAARLLGVRRPPRTVAQLEGALEAFRPDLHAGPDAIDVCRYLLREPPLPWSARIGYDLLSCGAREILPEWARTELGLTVPRTAHGAAAFGTRAVRWGMAAVA